MKYCRIGGEKRKRDEDGSLKYTCYIYDLITW